ncbi:MAG: NCS2 family permease [Epsilonproteobacteria bacterium]|nr:NCS2 family permease [Campylobacterota bacterium]
MPLIRLQTEGVDFKTEATAGFSTFLAMLYIVPVNAAILSQADMPFDALVTATILMTVLATVLNALWSDTPIAMSVGMGLNAYFTFGLVKGMGLAWQTALGIVFLSGVGYLVVSLTPLRRWMIETIPLDLKRAVSAGIGAFIALIGLEQMKLVVDSPATLVTLGNLHDPKVLLGLLALTLAVVLYVRHVRGAFILAILGTSAVAWITGIAPLPKTLFAMPASVTPIAFSLDIPSALSLSLLPVILTFLLTDLFDTMGTLTGVGMRAGLFEGEGKIKLQRTIEADAAATLLSGLIGVSSTTSFIESAAGVEAGGRTGWTALFTALFFLFTLFLLPLFEAIPGFAIFPILVVVGALMFAETAQIDFRDTAVLIGGFFMILLMPLTYSITDGLMLGSLAYVIARIAKDGPRRVEKALWIFAVCGLLLLFML